MVRYMITRVLGLASRTEIIMNKADDRLDVKRTGNKSALYIDPTEATAHHVPLCVCVCVCLFNVEDRVFPRSLGGGSGKSLVPVRDIRRADQNCLATSVTAILGLQLIECTRNPPPSESPKFSTTTIYMILRSNRIK